MDFLDPAKQRAHRIRLYVGYVLMTLAISLVALLLVFQAYGYDLNLRTGAITQKSLLFIDAHPEAAEVFLNGAPKGTTDKRLFVPADNYALELRREGYRTWRRDFTVMGGQIRRFVYPFMFPEKIDSTQMQLYAQEPDFVSQSPDRRWLIVREPNAVFGLSLVDLNSELASAAVLDLPPELFNTSGSTHQFELVEWSTNNQHVVLRHVFEGGAEFVLIDREVPRASVNLTRTFSSQQFTGLSLLDKQFDRYYLHNNSNGLLSSAVLRSGAITPLIENVIQFKPHGDDVILYVTTVNVPNGQAEVRLRQGNDAHTLRSLPASPSYLLDIARFNGRWYIAAGVASEEKVYILRDPQVALKRSPSSPLIPAATMRVENPEFVSFSTNARFVSVQSGAQIAVYDAELATSHRFDTKLSLPRGRQAVWMDGHRLSVIADGKVYAFDFDGTNQQELVPSYNNLRPLFNSDFTALYTLAPSQIEGRAALFRSSLRVTP
jgi:hypothetical protein